MGSRGVGGGEEGGGHNSLRFSPVNICIKYNQYEC